MDSVPEVWKAVPGHKGYESSNLGRVRSCDRVITQVRHGKEFSRKWKGRILVGVPHRGYFVTKLGKCETLFGIHQLIALAWIGPRPGGAVVNHLNGIKTDNRPENLEYCTSRENVLHAYRTGLLNNTESNNGRTIATKQQVQSACDLVLSGMTKKEAAKRVGIAPYIVSNAMSGRQWKSITKG